MSKERRPIGRLIRIVALVAAVLVLISAVFVIPAWVPLWPRPLKRSVTEGLLRTVLFAHGAVVLVSFIATPVLAVVLLRSRRRGRRRPLLARGFLIAASCLFSLILLELSSTAWDLWMHKFPKLPESFSEPDTGSFRIVVLGGSRPPRRTFSPLAFRGPDRGLATRAGHGDFARLSVRSSPGSANRSKCSIASWRRSSGRPGMVIIYSGHNEFAARFEEERDGWLDPDPGEGLLRPIYRASLFSPFCRLAFELVSKNRLDVPPPLAGRHQLIDPPQCSPAEAEQIRIDFESRLEAITAYCEKIGALPVLIIPPANEADFEPSRSTLPQAVSPQERAFLVRDFLAARAARSVRSSSQRGGLRTHLGSVSRFCRGALSPGASARGRGPT